MEELKKSKIAPLSQTQLGIYFDCLHMGEGAYNRHFLYTLDNSLDMPLLAKAVEKSVDAHPYMFVKISEIDGEPHQVLEPAENYHQEVLKMTEAEWENFLQNPLKEPLELIGGQLFRFDLVETEKAKYFLTTNHHIAFDGTSYKFFLMTFRQFMKVKKFFPKLTTQ